MDFHTTYECRGCGQTTDGSACRCTTEVPPAKSRFDGDRTVTRMGTIVIVSYLKSAWSKADAWVHLESNRPAGAPKDDTDPRANNNPWRRCHTTSSWAWKYDPAEFV